MISKLASYEELDCVALVTSSLIGAIVANEELCNARSNQSRTSVTNYKRVDAEEIFKKLGPTYSCRSY